MSNLTPYQKSVIFMVRGQQIILDSDLAEFYGMTVSIFNRQRKRKTEFEAPVFELTREEYNEILAKKGLPARKGGNLPTAYPRRASLEMAFAVSSKVAMKIQHVILSVFESALDGKLVATDKQTETLVQEAHSQTLIYNTYNAPVTLIQGSHNTVNIGSSTDAFQALSQIMASNQFTQNKEMMTLLLDSIKELNNKNKPGVIDTLAKITDLGEKIGPIALKYIPLIIKWLSV